jgi:hypothetical protein
MSIINVVAIKASDTNILKILMFFCTRKSDIITNNIIFPPARFRNMIGTIINTMNNNNADDSLIPNNGSLSINRINGPRKIIVGAR